MGEVWIKEAEQLKPAGNHNAMSGIGGPRATLHCTVSNPGSFNAMHRVLVDKKAEPHLLYDGKTDRLGQYFPLDRAARALARGTLAYSHNRVGSVNIQIEVCNMPVDWTASSDWNPGPNFRAMIRAIRSWGIKDEFIFRPARTGGDRANVVRPDRLLTSTDGGGKWWGHCHYGQGESHWDPGPLNLDKFFAAAQEDDMPLTDADARKLLTETKVVPSLMLGNEDTVSVARALDLMMRWALEARDNAVVARKVSEAQAKLGRPLTADEVKAAVSAALSEKAQIDVVVKQGM